MLDRTVQREKGKWCDLEAQTEPEPPLHKFYIGSSVYLKYLIINGNLLARNVLYILPYLYSSIL